MLDQETEVYINFVITCFTTTIIILIWTIMGGNKRKNEVQEHAQPLTPVDQAMPCLEENTAMAEARTLYVKDLHMPRTSGES